MKNDLLKSLLTISFFIFFGAQVTAQHNWLGSSATRIQVASYLKSIAGWREIKKQSLQQAIDRLPEEIKQSLIQKSEGNLSYAWPNLPATVFLEFGKNGNRSNYQSIRGERRRILSVLVIGELLEHKGRFIPQIANGIWAICEESTWAYPAHLGLQKKYTPLPNPGEAIVDLGAGETAAQMSWTYFLLKDELDKISGVVGERMRYELEKRIIRPYLNRDDFWWMGLQGQAVNNWNPWVNGNVLLTDLLIETDNSTIASVVYKTMQSVDHFINQYPADGGCDEGPSYWSVAGGALIKYLELLKDVTDGKIDITGHPLICNMGRYIYKLNIDKNEFVDFADAHRYATPDISAVFAFGKVCNNDTLKQFAAYFAHQGGDAEEKFLGMEGNLHSFMNYLDIYAEISKITPQEPLLKQAWLPDLQVLTARSRGGSAEGLFLAAKGGTNDESHNHNDVGNFIIYVNGEPAIIDIGVGTYTRETFSKDRYKIFTMQSSWHNLPTINGVMQHAGKDFRAKDVRFSNEGNAVHLSMDIASTYPKEAEVKSWTRSLSFGRTQIDLEEKYTLRAFKKASVLSLITPLQVQVKGDTIVLRDKKQHYGLKIHFDPQQFEVKIEDKLLEDPSLLGAWPDSFRRIQLVNKQATLTGSYTLIFQAL